MSGDMKVLEQTLKALANKRRLKVLGMLQQRKRMNVSQIAFGLRLSFRSTSRHLAVLYKAKLLEREQVHLEVYYSLARNLPPVARKVLQEL